MRMDADGTPDIVVSLRNSADFHETGHPGADRHHGLNARVAGALDGFGAVFVEDIEIEMAMAVYNHAAGPSWFDIRACVAHKQYNFTKKALCMPNC
jgi:hypothetical protein